jgi:hypothetical protein
MKKINWKAQPRKMLEKRAMAEVLGLTKKKGTKKTHATQRSLRHLEAHGWQCAIVEKWIPARGKMKFGIRRDVWGFGDLLVCRPPVQVNGIQVIPGRTALIQCFPDARFKDHREKMLGTPEIALALNLWKLAGNKVFLHGWRKTKSMGWILHEEEI